MEDSRKAWLRKHFPSGSFIAVAALIGSALAGIVVYVGAYDIGADSPHTRPVYWLIEQLRDRSIAVRARNVGVPANLADAKRLQSGAGLYTEMCSGCHLGPGLERTEISQGLYPRAPELGRGVNLTPEQEFWVIKHGVKLTGMAAWGPTHNDTLIWDMVAFLRKLPSLSPAQYQVAVKSAPEDHDEMMKDMHMDDGAHH